MPCATIHMMTAGRTLAEWDRHPRRAPFDSGRAGLRAAFLLGAMGPDMGFVPGVDRLVSELAHYVSTGDLTRRILEEARTPSQSAFAWGWATHHVTDVEIHPLVGRACGDYVLGDRTVRMNASDDLEAHVAMEVGLDLVFLLEDAAIPTPPTTPCFRRSEVGFLSRALGATYGIPWEDRLVHRAHRTAALRTARWPSALSILGRARGFDRRTGGTGIPERVLHRIVRLAGRLVPPGSALGGFLRPLPPPEWAVAEVREAADAFPDRFQDLVDSNLSGLQNRNLETGRPEDDAVEHPDSARTVRHLRELRSQRESDGGELQASAPSAAESASAASSPSSRA